MNLTKLERRMAIIMCLMLSMVEPDYEEEYDLMPNEIRDWADPALWRESCIRPEDRRM